MSQKRKLIVNVTASVHTTLNSPLPIESVEQKLQAQFEKTDSIFTLTGMISFRGKIHPNDTFHIQRLAHRGTSVYATGKMYTEEEGSRLEITFRSTIITKILTALCIVLIVLTLGIGIFIFGPFYALLSYAYQKEIEMLDDYFKEELQAVSSSD